MLGESFYRKNEPAITRTVPRNFLLLAILQNPLMMSTYSLHHRNNFSCVSQNYTVCLHSQLQQHSGLRRDDHRFPLGQRFASLRVRKTTFRQLCSRGKHHFVERNGSRNARLRVKLCEIVMGFGVTRKIELDDQDLQS